MNNQKTQSDGEVDVKRSASYNLRFEVSHFFLRFLIKTKNLLNKKEAEKKVLHNLNNKSCKLSVKRWK